ncbi:MAG: hypothetical protein WA624_17425 [Methylocella sp.]
MQHRFSSGRTKALKAEARKLFETQTFSAFKMPIGIVCTNYDFERPMVFKYSVHNHMVEHQPSSQGSAAPLLMPLSRPAPPILFFQMMTVNTENQGDQLLMDGGYVANNPTLFALAGDAFKGNQRGECVRMPRRTPSSAPSTTV